MSQTTLATPTIARLYLQQGHYDKARTVLDAILRASPWHGEALALSERLELCDQGLLKSKVVADRLDITWQVPRERLAQQLVVRIDCFVEGAVSAQSAELACDGLRGKLAYPLPLGPGACTLCLVHREIADDREPVSIVAVGRVHQWAQRA